jgi:hypothetical protein
VPEQIFVSNLPNDATSEDIKKHFEKSGNVLSVNLKLDRRGRSRCFCFILMDNADQALSGNGVSEMSGRKLHIAKAHQIEPQRPYFERRFRR